MLNSPELDVIRFVSLAALACATSCDPVAAGSVDLVYLSSRLGETPLMGFDFGTSTSAAIEAAGTVNQAAAFLESDVLVTARNGALFRLDLESGVERVIELPNLQASGPVVDVADILVSAAGDDGNQDIYRISDGREPERLTTDAGFDAPGGVTGAGDIVFVSNRSGRFDIWTMASDGSEARPLIVDSGVFGRPATSPDGQTLCWEGPSGLMVAALDGTPEPLGGGLIGGDPAIHADGRVFFRRFVGDAAEVFVFNPADGTTTQVTTDGAVASSPALAP